MISSILKNGQIIFGVDYSGKEELLKVVDFTKEEIYKLQNGCKYEDGEIIETQEYLQKIELKDRENIVSELKKLSESSIKNLSQYDAVDRMYNDSEIKQYKLSVLEKRGQELLANIDKLEEEAINKYGMEILKEI